MYYSIASSVCLSVCLGLVGPTISPRILKLGTFDQHGEKKIPIIFQGQRSRSYCHKVGKCRWDTYWTISSRIIQLGTIVQHDERKMPIVFQRSRSGIIHYMVPEQNMDLWGDPSLIRYSSKTTEQNFMKLSGIVHYMVPYCTSYFKFLFEWFWGFPQQIRDFVQGLVVWGGTNLSSTFH